MLQCRWSDWRADPKAFELQPRYKIESMSEVLFDPENENQPDVAQQEQSMPLPPPSFLFLVLSMRAQCEIQLGLMNFGQEEKNEPNLPVARHTIDLMAMLLEKTKGNLSMEEHRTLENS